MSSGCLSSIFFLFLLFLLLAFAFWAKENKMSKQTDLIAAPAAFPLDRFTSSLKQVQSAERKQECRERTGAALGSRSSKVTRVTFRSRSSFFFLTGQLKACSVCITESRQEIHRHLGSAPSVPLTTHLHLPAAQSLFFCDCQRTSACVRTSQQTFFTFPSCPLTGN